MAYQQHLTYLPGVLAGARINANFTYTESKNYNLRAAPIPRRWWVRRHYPGTSHLPTRRNATGNGRHFHNGANIYAYQYQDGAACGVTGPFGDNYFYSHTQVDAQGSYYIGKGFTAIASGQNMNNAVFGFYNGSLQYMIQREYYKPTYSGGVRWESKSTR